MITTGILLAAGKSRRFGTGNKLLANLNGRPLVSYAADSLRASSCDELIAVVADSEVAKLLADFKPVSPTGATMLSSSIRSGIRYAQEHGAARALLVLGDMPNVTPMHLSEVLALATTLQAAASTDGVRRSPPACFPACEFARLTEIDGDRGASDLLASLPKSQLAVAAPNELRDVDRPEDL